MLEGLNAEKANQFAHRITSYMRNGAGRRYMAASLFIPQTLSYPAPSHHLPTPCLAYSPPALLCPGNLTLILRNSIHRVHVCMTPETADFEDKNANRDKKYFTRIREELKGIYHITW